MRRLVFGLSVLATVACEQEPQKRLPYVDQSCQSKDCGGIGGGPGGGGSRPPPSPTDDGASSNGETLGDAGLGVVLLEPRQAADLEQTQAEALNRPYAVFAWPNTTTPILRSNGAAPEALNIAGSGQWLLVQVNSGNDPDAAWLPSLVWQTPADGSSVVPLFSVRFWSDMAESQATAPMPLRPEAAQVLLRVTDERDVPLAGVSATATSGAIAYGVGGTATDALTSTTDTGVIAWINAPVDERASLTLALGGEQWAAALPTRAGTLTVVRLHR
jgi:hypothetical protein